MVAERSTIKAWAHEHFLRVNFVDINGRSVGFDYDHILTELRKEFPRAKTSRRWLQMMAYDLNGHVRMPVRHRSLRVSALEYAKTLLIDPMAMSYLAIFWRVRRKFPGKVSMPEVRKLEAQLGRKGYAIPKRAG